MTYPAYIRDKAVELRVARNLSVNEIAKRLGIAKATIFAWVGDIPLGRPRSTAGQHMGNKGMQLKYKLLRDAAYEQGWEEYDELVKEPSFRDFVCMYIGEGYKRCRNTVSLANSDSNVVILADLWIRRYSRNPVTYWLQYHADQDIEELRRFWSQILKIEPSQVRFQRKSNSNQLAGRAWRSRWGVMTVNANDTLLRARLQAWIDRTTEYWLDCAGSGA